MSATNTISITPSAAKRVGELISAEGGGALMLRIAVSAGGCSGFSYGFDLDGKRNEDDVVFEDHGIKVIVDKMSLEILGNTEIDFADDLMGAAFKLNIPNATSTCGCGVSFAV